LCSIQEPSDRVLPSLEPSSYRTTSSAASCLVAAAFTLDPPLFNIEYPLVIFGRLDAEKGRNGSVTPQLTRNGDLIAPPSGD
jgi:hypothetical protein